MTRIRIRVLASLRECCGKTDWQMLAWSVMRNHFHWVVDGSGNGYLKTVCEYV